MDRLCSVSSLLLSVLCCIALIHVELRMQEHHRLISHPVNFCDNMEGIILRKLQEDYGRWQFMTASRHWQKAKGRFRYITEVNTFLCNLSVTVACLLLCPGMRHIVIFSVFQTQLSSETESNGSRHVEINGFHFSGKQDAISRTKRSPPVDSQQKSTIKPWKFKC